MIDIRNLCKSYFLGEEEVRAVCRVNLKIKPGEYVSILGSSGSGKSTLMHLIGLLESLTSGKIIFEGRDVSALPDIELSRLRNEKIGFVFQSFNLINKFTVLENVVLPTRYFKGKLKFDPEKRAKDLLEKFGIYERRNFFPNNISGGQQQRVAIARALIMNPKIILADEPTGNLDTKTGREILNILEDLNRDLGVTVVVVTHEKAIAKRTKRQIYMRDGVVVKKYL